MEGWNYPETLGLDKEGKAGHFYNFKGMAYVMVGRWGELDKKLKREVISLVLSR